MTNTKTVECPYCDADIEVAYTLGEGDEWPVSRYEGARRYVYVDRLDLPDMCPTCGNEFTAASERAIRDNLDPVDLYLETR